MPHQQCPQHFRLRSEYHTVNFYTGAADMYAEKTVSVSFLVAPKPKALLELAAASENRSLTNMLETLVFAYCEQHGLSVPPAKASQCKGAKK
jgi:hypothetical protein